MRFSDSHASLLGAISVGVLGALGCGAADEFPATFPVSGVVTFNGAPVDDANVSFIPAGGGAGADTFTDAEGAFTVQTVFAQGKEYRDGMRPGEYQVAVQKLAFDPARGRAPHQGTRCQRSTPTQRARASPRPSRNRARASSRSN